MASPHSRPVRAVVLAGGSGTRLWPRSTDARPKPFLPLAGGRSLIAETVARAARVAGDDNVLLSARDTHAPHLAAEFPALPSARLVLEPDRRNTAPAIALAALTIAGSAPDAVLVVLPSDQAVKDAEAFHEALAAAVEAAATGEAFVTLGIPPTRPETGFGYLETGEAVRGEKVRRVVRFVEKPPLAKAEEYLAKGTFLWNAGIFVFALPLLLAEMERLCPEVLAAVRKAHAARAAGDHEGFVAAFRACRSVSIDYAVMEKAAAVWTVPAPCGWSDLGSWEAVFDIRGGTPASNVVEGPAAVEGGTGNLVLADGRPVKLIGLSGVVVVDSPDGLLVMAQGASDALRESVERSLREARR